MCCGCTYFPCFVKSFWNHFDICVSQSMLFCILVQVLGRKSPFPLILLPQFGGYWIEGTNHELTDTGDSEQLQPLSPNTRTKLECNTTAMIYRKHFLGKVSPFWIWPPPPPPFAYKSFMYVRKYSNKQCYNVKKNNLKYIHLWRQNYLYILHSIHFPQFSWSHLLISIIL